MKKWILFFLLLPLFSFSQYQYGFLSEHFFFRQPSARAEAMGKGYVSVDGDISSSFYNPAGISSIKGLVINGSYSSPLYLINKGYYTFFGAGYRINKKIQFAFTRFRFDYVNTPIMGVENHPYSETFSLTLSSEPLRNLYVGLNINEFVLQNGFGKPTLTPDFDFGVIKKILLHQTNKVLHSVNIGASIFNFNYASIKLQPTTQIEKLPVITRIGANYQFSLSKNILFDSLRTIKFLIQSEYQKLLNSEYNTAIRAGCEIQIFEILALRVGYYNEKVYDYGIPEYNVKTISDLTYGFGLQIPLSKLTKIPININFDYTSLPQVSYSKIMTDWDNFTSYNLRVNWLFGK